MSRQVKIRGFVATLLLLVAASATIRGHGDVASWGWLWGILAGGAASIGVHQIIVASTQYTLEKLREAAERLRDAK